MDVHDLARALLAETPLLVGWEQRSETVRVQTWRRIALAYYEAQRLLPFLLADREAHTRAAVEAERAACEVEVLSRLQLTHDGYDSTGSERRNGTLRAIAHAIAARRQP
jgi:hypothetical protein